MTPAENTVMPESYELSIQTIRDGRWTEVSRHLTGSRALEELGTSAVGLGVDVGVWVRVELIHCGEVLGRKEVRSTAPVEALGAPVDVVVQEHQPDEEPAVAVPVTDEESVTRRRARALVDVVEAHRFVLGRPVCGCGQGYDDVAGRRLHVAEQVLIAIGSASMAVKARPEITEKTASTLAHRESATRRELLAVVADLTAVVTAQDEALRASSIGYDTLADIHDDHVAELREAADRHLMDGRLIDRFRDEAITRGERLRALGRDYGRASATIGGQRATLALLRESRDRADAATLAAHEEISTARVRVRAALGEADAVDLGATPLDVLIGRLAAQATDPQVAVRRLAEWLSRSGYLGDVHQAAAAAWSHVIAPTAAAAEAPTSGVDGAE